MVKIEKLATDLQDELNDFLDEKELFNVRFKIFADAGKFSKAKKILNDTTYYINGCLLQDSSEVKVLSQGTKMAVINFSFDFAVPTQLPRGILIPDDFTGTYYYPVLIRNLVDEYFAQKKAISLEANGFNYFGSINFGFLNTGDINSTVGLGENVLYNSYLTYIMNLFFKQYLPHNMLISGLFRVIIPTFLERSFFNGFKLF